LFPEEVARPTFGALVGDCFLIVLEGTGYELPTSELDVIY